MSTPLSSGKYQDSSYSLGLVRFKTSESRRISYYKKQHKHSECPNSDLLMIKVLLISIISRSLLTLVSILGGSGGPRAGIVSCLAAPQSENPTKFLDPKRKSYVVLGIRFSKMYSPVKPVKTRTRVSVF